jgi:hypothetical protein
MTSADDLAWGTVTPRKHRHSWVWKHEPPVEVWGEHVAWRECSKCGARADELTSRRGKNNRARGNAIERDVAKQLGLKRVGMYGGPEDVGTAADPFIVQVKSGNSCPERLYRWLKALPSNASQTALVVVTDAPGPGHRRRALVVLTLEDWVALHGPLTSASVEAEG